MKLGVGGAYILGNVGIGTAYPTYDLDVSGNINTTGLCINGDCKTDWSQVGGGGGWGLTGNAGTNSGTNFIGTTDDMDVIFKRNNVRAGWLNSGSGNTSW